MTKKSNKGDPSLFCPEFREIARRSKTTEPELETMVEREDHTAHANLTQEELDAFVVGIIRRELSSIVEGLGAADRSRGVGVVKKTVSIPRDLWEEFRSAFPGEASGHVAQAIRLLLAMRGRDQS